MRKVLILDTSILCVWLAVPGMVHSFTAISKAAGTVATGNYSEPIPVHGRDEIAQLTQSFNTMVMGLKERDLIANTFGRYVDQGIARELLKRPEAAKLGGRKREVAILMSDIRGFTSLSETLAPEEIIRFLIGYPGQIWHCGVPRKPHPANSVNG